MTTDDSMALRALVEQAADADLVRGMLAFAASALMDASREDGLAYRDFPASTGPRSHPRTPSSR